MEPVACHVAICDDDPLVRSALATYISSTEDLAVHLSCSSGDALLAAKELGRVDVLLLDVRMPRMDGPAVARHLSQNYPKVAILYLTSYVEDLPVEDALEGRVLGALSKDLPPQDLFTAIRAAHRGLSVMSPAVRRRVRPPLDERIDHLARTDRESTILRSVATGLSNADIADRMYLSESTVKQAVLELTRRAHAKNRAQLVAHLWSNDTTLKRKHDTDIP